MGDNDLSEQLAAQVQAARDSNRPLRIVGGDTKRFYGRDTEGELLALAEHTGVVAYDPAELVVTVRAGTSLSELDNTLAERGQFLAFESPRFGETTTIGGAVAAGLAGPRRPWVGGVRDFVLGAKVLTGRGETLSFGGQVMKNVAGYDVSRLMAGSMGCLGVILEVSLKVLPLPQAEITLALDLDVDRGSELLVELGRRPIPLSGASHDGSVLRLRLSGGPASVEAAKNEIGGDVIDDDHWDRLRDHRLDFFDGRDPLWRISTPQTAPQLDLPGSWLYDWGGAQRWLRSDADSAAIYSAAESVGGHATLFKGNGTDGEVFQPLSPPLMRLHRNLKRAMDPDGILNPGRMYAEL